MSVRMLNGKASTNSCTHKLSALRSEFWLLFRASGKSIKFYDVPVGCAKEELRFRCELEPFNARDADIVRLKHRLTMSEVPKHFAREASAHLAPLLLSGVHTEE